MHSMFIICIFIYLTTVDLKMLTLNAFYYFCYRTIRAHKLMTKKFSATAPPLRNGNNQQTNNDADSSDDDM
jgi:hypothetical protein